MSLSKFIKLISTVKELMFSTKIKESTQTRAIDKKINKVMDKNVKFNQLQKILNILKGFNDFVDRMPEDFTSRDLPFFKFVLINVESFFFFSR